MSQADKWTLNLTAATQYHQREGHLNVPRKHVEPVDVDERGLPSAVPGEGLDVREIKLGAFIANCRVRRTSLTKERIAQLDAIDMRWPG